MIRPHGCRRRWLTAVTRHGKAHALRTALRRTVGVRPFTPRDLDTDALRTFKRLT